MRLGVSSHSYQTLQAKITIVCNQNICFNYCAIQENSMVKLNYLDFNPSRGVAMFLVSHGPF